MDPAEAGRWAVLARWSDRVDPRALLAPVGGDVNHLGEPALRDAGAPAGLVRAWRGPPPETEPPWATVGDAHYPSALLDLPRPPPALWLRGDPGVLRLSGVAVVGARACTPYGRRIARQLGGGLAAAGGLVVSGGARGIDSEAHAGAAASGATVAVLGAGLATRFGPSATRLLHSILDAGGCLVSELPPHDPASRRTFPRRNRIIAALASATVVVEAGLRSGARITARLAAELGREVHAVPGPLGAPASAGCLRLITEGAQVVEDLGELMGLARGSGGPAGHGVALLAALEEPRTPGELARLLDRPCPEVFQELVLLELGGAVVRTPGGRYAARR